MEDTPNRPIGGLIAGAIVVALLAAYLLGFYALGSNATATIGPRTLHVHVYPYQWQADVFRPLARVEAVLVGEEVDTAYRN